MSQDENSRRKRIVVDEKFVSNYIHRLFAYCLRNLTRNQQDAEDLTQETFVRAIRYGLPKPMSDDAFPLLARIARRIHLNASGHQSHLPLPTEIPSTNENNPAISVELRDMHLWLMQGLENLPVSERIVLNLWLSDSELSWQKIADALNITLDVAKKRRAKAIKRLRARADHSDSKFRIRPR